MAGGGKPEHEPKGAERLEPRLPSLFSIMNSAQACATYLLALPRMSLDYLHISSSTPEYI
jgi:hypothetical protein